MPAPKDDKKRISVIYIIIAILLLFCIQFLLVIPSMPQKAAYTDFIDALNAQNISAARISDTEIVWQYKDSNKWVTTDRIPGVDDTELVQRLAEQGVPITGYIPNRFLTTLLSWVIPIIIFVFIWYLIISRMGRQEYLNFGRSKARIYDKGSVKVNFSCVAGVDEAKAELMEIVDFLKDPTKYQRLGGKLPKGILLVGPPGTGKTLLARATAGEAGVPFYSISGSEFVEMFVGVGAARVRDLFEQAKKNAPCIIFIDEIDTIGKRRGGLTAIRHDEQEQTLNQLLAEMDGFDSSKGVIIMAATNRPDILDPALLRPGRFDRQIVIDKPDMKGREEILKVHAKRVKLSPDVDLKIIAARTPGFAGAELANVINEGALLAARRGKDMVGMEDLEEAIDRVMAGLERKSRVLTEEEKERVAYHEMGHAIIALLLPNADKVYKVSIIPRGSAALGMTLQLPLQDKYLFTREELETKIRVLLGGRASEDVIYGEISTGAQNDLYQATQLARHMVCTFGMSKKLGPLTFGDIDKSYIDKTAPMYNLSERQYSEETAKIIDNEVYEIINGNYVHVKNLLEENKRPLIELAKDLIEKETISGDELRKRFEQLSN